MWSAGVVWLEVLLGTPQVFQVCNRLPRLTSVRMIMLSRLHEVGGWSADI